MDRYEREVTPSKKGARQERTKIRKLQESFFSTLYLQDIRPTDVAAYRDERLEEVKPETVRKYLSLISDLFNHARTEWGLKVTNPVNDIKRPAPSRARDRRLSPKEEKKLLQAAKKHPNHEFLAIINITLETAMRQGEILSMTWENFDVKKRKLYWPDTKNGEPRYVPLSTNAIKIFKSLGMKKRGQIFNYTQDGFRTIWHKIKTKEELGLADLRFHDLRHEATSRFVELGLDSLEVSAITGHKTLQMLKRYTHLKAENLAKKLK